MSGGHQEKGQQQLHQFASLLIWVSASPILA
jgi:hypothetical protein